MGCFGITGPRTSARYPVVRNDHFHLGCLLSGHWVTWVGASLVLFVEDRYEKQLAYAWVLGFQYLGIFSSLGIGKPSMQRERMGWGGEAACSVKSSKAEGKEQVVLL